MPDGRLGRTSRKQETNYSHVSVFTVFPNQLSCFVQSHVTSFQIIRLLVSLLYPQGTVFFLVLWLFSFFSVYPSVFFLANKRKLYFLQRIFPGGCSLPPGRFCGYSSTSLNFCCRKTFSDLHRYSEISGQSIFPFFSHTIVYFYLWSFFCPSINFVVPLESAPICSLESFPNPALQQDFTMSPSISNHELHLTPKLKWQ